MGNGLPVRQNQLSCKCDGMDRRYPEPQNSVKGSTESMKETLTINWAAMTLAALANATGLATPADNQEAVSRDPVLPLIVIEEVPLPDAIRNLARQMNLNYILDPRVPGSNFGPGRSAP